MDTQIIGLWIGLFITFVLGLVNFLWGPAILARREKVTIVDPAIFTYFLPKGVKSVGKYKKPAIFKSHTLQFVVRCNLVLTSGEKDIEVNGVYCKLDEVIRGQLGEYFRPYYEEAPPHFIFPFTYTL